MILTVKIKIKYENLMTLNSLFMLKASLKYSEHRFNTRGLSMRTYEWIKISNKKLDTAQTGHESSVKHTEEKTWTHKQWLKTL